MMKDIPFCQLGSINLQLKFVSLAGIILFWNTTLTLQVSRADQIGSIPVL